MSNLGVALPALEALFEVYSAHPLCRVPRVDLVEGLLDPFNSDVSVDVGSPAGAAAAVDAAVGAGWVAVYSNGKVRLTAAGARALRKYNVDNGYWSA